MECPIESGENAELLLGSGSRTLDPETAALVARHVAGCPNCQAFSAAQRRVWSALDAWEAPPVSPDFDDRLYRKIEERDHAAWWRRAFLAGSRLSWRPAFSLAAASVVVVAVLLLRSPSTPTVPVQDRTEAVDIEQVEKTLEDMEMLKQLYVSTRTEATTSKSL